MTNFRKVLTKKCLVKVFLLTLFFFAIHHILTDTAFYIFANSSNTGWTNSCKVWWATYEHSRSTSIVQAAPTATTILYSKRTSPLKTEQSFKLTQPPLASITEAKLRPGDNSYKNITDSPDSSHSLLHVLLVTYPRSGSSFVGKLLQSPKQAFYHFEPVHFLLDYTRPRRSRRIRTSIRPVFRTQNPQEFLKDVFQCKYSQRFMQWAEMRSNYKTLERNERYWSHCLKGNNSKLCYNAVYFKRYCNNYSMQVIKTIRLNIINVQQLLEKYKDLNLKIIHLVRDPRGTMNSRSKKPIANWCRKDITCYSPRVFCAGLDGDLLQSEKLKQKYPNSYFILRYEDLCCNMYQQTEKIFRFLGFGDLPQETIDFLNSHNLAIPQNTTVVKEKYLEPSYTTVRNSMQTALAWRKELKFSHVKVIQRHCEVVMRKLGYYPLISPEEMTNSTFRTMPNTTDCDP